MRRLGSARLAMLAGAAAITSWWVIGVQPVAAQSASTAHTGRSVVLGAPRLVSNHGPAAPTGSTASRAHHVRNPAALQAAKRQVKASSATAIATRAGTPAQAGPSSRQAQPLTAGFPLMSRDQEKTAFNQNVEPPDTQVAAGSTSLLEMVNQSGSIWDKATGAAVGAPFDLHVFPFAVPAGLAFTDPRVLYDATNSRWIATGAAFSAPNTPSHFQAYLANSITSDPGGTWSVHTIYDSTADLCDQPKLGMSNDKLVVACDLYTGSNSAFDGAVDMVFSKSQILSGLANPLKTTFGPFTYAFSIAPAISLSSTNTEYLVYNLGDQPQGLNPYLGVLRVTGNPTIASGQPGGLQQEEVDTDIAPTRVPPPAPQAGVTCHPENAVPNGCIETNDDRLLSATFKDGMLWTAANDACVPQGELATRACIRLFQIDVSQWPGVNAVRDGDISVAGAYLYYPALTVDLFGNAVIAYTQSSPTMAAGAVAVDFLTAFGALDTAVSIVPGAASYPGKRWGDYSAAVPDPLNPADIWVGAQYTAAGTSGNWGTGALRMAVRPMITDLSVTTGPPGGGQRVTINGYYFQPGATVTFGTTPGVNPTVSANSIQVTTPPHAEGTVAVSVSNPDGTKTANPFSYVYLLGIYTMDGFGGIHPDGGSAAMSGGPYWANWKIARSSVLLADATGGYVLDGYGGIQPFGQAAPVAGAPYFGWDIARDIVLMPGSTKASAGGYVLDGWGGLHPFHTAGALQGSPTPTPYWKNWDIAKRVVIVGSGEGGFVMDGYGGLHPFGIGAGAPPSINPNHAYWPNWTIARDVVLLPGSTGTNAPGLILDGYGGLHPFNFSGAATGAAYFPGNDFAVAVEVSPAAATGNLQGWVMDAWGGLHAFGGAGTVSPSPYWPNWRIAVQVMVR